MENQEIFRKENNTFSNNNGYNLDYFDPKYDLGSFPPGYRFNPSDEELVEHYLRRKLKNLPLPKNKIHEINLYQEDPEKLQGYQPQGEKVWYFFTSTYKKYTKGKRPSRITPNGHWRASAKNHPVKLNGHQIGSRKTLVFHKNGKTPKGIKTNWIMQEYKLDTPSTISQRPQNDTRLDEWVLCKVYKTAYKQSGTQEVVDDEMNVENEQVPIMISSSAQDTIAGKSIYEGTYTMQSSDIVAETSGPSMPNFNNYELPKTSPVLHSSPTIGTNIDQFINFNQPQISTSTYECPQTSLVPSSPSNIYPDQFINFHHQRTAEPPRYQMLNQEAFTNSEGCEETFEIPVGMSTEEMDSLYAQTLTAEPPHELLNQKASTNSEGCDEPFEIPVGLSTEEMDSLFSPSHEPFEISREGQHILLGCFRKTTPRLGECFCC